MLLLDSPALSEASEPELARRSCLQFSTTDKYERIDVSERQRERALHRLSTELLREVENAEDTAAFLMDPKLINNGTWSYQTLREPLPSYTRGAYFVLYSDYTVHVISLVSSCPM